jgi:hypothetical protein
MGRKDKDRILPMELENFARAALGAKLLQALECQSVTIAKLVVTRFGLE